jgi:hypothetical protein
MLGNLDQQIHDAYQNGHDCAERAKTAVTLQETNHAAHGTSSH